MERGLQSHPYTGWQLIKVYWQSEQWLSATILLASVLLLTLFSIGLEVIFNYWNQHFFDSLQDYKKKEVFAWLWIFIFLAAVWIINAVYLYYLRSMLGLRWRRWLTHQFIGRWLDKRSYYYLENFDDKTDNPDQRIQEDVNLIVNFSLSLFLGLVNSVTTIIAFIYILWTLSGDFVIPLGHFGKLTIPGYLVWVSIIYSAIGTWITVKMGSPLVQLNFEQQRREANFRFSAIDLRSHAEHIALYQGEHHQKNVLDTSFDKALDNWYLIILRQKLLLWFTAGYAQIAIFIPIIAALPNYFGKVFRLGGFMQALRAFGQIQDAFSFIVTSYTTIAEWQAVKRRLLTFMNHMNEVEVSASKHNHFKVTEIPQNKITLNHVKILTPREEPLLDKVDIEFTHGKHYLIKGPSGIGKSTLIRAVAGIWPYGSGDIALPQGKNIMYVPQKSYMPLGTLSDALLFPDHVLRLSDSVLVELLKEIGLPELVNRLEDVAMWSQQLSPGEQQRIAFIRVLIHKPDWVFLDESTSALDLASEQKMYQFLQAKLPNCSIISVGHRPTLDQYHNEIVDIARFSVAMPKQEMV